MDVEPAAITPIKKAVLQRMRSGGGKWVVRVLFTPQPDPARLSELARQVKKALGTGARIDENGGTALLVQGDIPDRVEAWLKGLGVPKVVR